MTYLMTTAMNTPTFAPDNGARRKLGQKEEARDYYAVQQTNYIASQYSQARGRSGATFFVQHPLL
jgi:hypothetical protein